MIRPAFTPKLAPAIVIAALGLGAGAATTVAAENTTLPLDCSVQVTDLGRMVELQAMLASSVSAHGAYDLEIEKSGRSGSTMINQGGRFSLQAGDEILLGQTTLSGDIDEYTINLTLRWNGLSLSCPVLDI